MTVPPCTTDLVEQRKRLLEGNRVLDTAEGVLIGLRRCGWEAALEELVAAAQRHGVPVISLSFALVTRASGDRDDYEPDHAAQCAARCEWGHLLD